jgi:hypothetical protein
MRKNYFGREIDLRNGDERSEGKEDEHETRWSSPQVRPEASANSAVQAGAIVDKSAVQTNLVRYDPKAKIRSALGFHRQQQELPFPKAVSCLSFFSESLHSGSSR